MDQLLIEPKPKKNCHLKPSQALPLFRNKSGEIKKFNGSFNEFSVVISNEEDIKTLISNGYFGKANLSRSYPTFNQVKPEIIRERVFQARKKLGEASGSVPEKVIVVPDSDSDNEDYFTNLKPRYEIDRSGLREELCLGLEEAFFLAHNLECLNIYHNDKLLEVPDIWEMFKASDSNFITNYVVYYHFRAKNWVVKTGVKFGGDFLLYKQGPQFFHASYVVIINIVDEASKIIEEYRRRSMKMVHLMGLNRLCETAGKELLICEVIWPQNLPEITHADLEKFKIREILMKRWLPSQERHSLEDN